MTKPKTIKEQLVAQESETEPLKEKLVLSEKKSDNLRKATESWCATVDFIIVKIAILILLIYEIASFVISKFDNLS